MDLPPYQCLKIVLIYALFGFNFFNFDFSEIEQIKREIAIRKRERISINLLMRPEVNIVIEQLLNSLFNIY